jgi:bacterial/archaeal transporter family protein
MWILYASLSAITAAFMTVIAKVGLKNVDPTLATGIRSLFMFLFMVGVVGLTGKLKGIQALDRNAVLAIIVSAVFGALSWLFYFIALKSGDATKVAAIDRTSLAFILVLSIIFLAEKLTWKLAIGTILVTAGAVVVAL